MMLAIIVSQKSNKITDNVMTIIKGYEQTTITWIYEFIQEGKTHAHLINEIISEMKIFMSVYNKLAGSKAFQFLAGLQEDEEGLHIKKYPNLAHAAVIYHKIREQGFKIEEYTVAHSRIPNLEHYVSKPLPTSMVGENVVHALWKIRLTRPAGTGK